MKESTVQFIAHWAVNALLIYIGVRLERFRAKRKAEKEAATNVSPIRKATYNPKEFRREERTDTNW